MYNTLVPKCGHPQQLWEQRAVFFHSPSPLKAKPLLCQLSALTESICDMWHLYSIFLSCFSKMSKHVFATLLFLSFVANWRLLLPHARHRGSRDGGKTRPLAHAVRNGFGNQMVTQLSLFAFGPFPFTPLKALSLGGSLPWITQKYQGVYYNHAAWSSVPRAHPYAMAPPWGGPSYGFQVAGLHTGCVKQVC